MRWRCVNRPSSSEPDDAWVVEGGMLASLLLACVAPTPAAFITFPALPRSVACLGDVDGDGWADVAVGETEFRGSGWALVLSGKTGRLLASVHGPDGAGLFGASVAEWVDFDGDGVRDFAVGAPGQWCRIPAAPHSDGAVFVCSGKTAAVLARLPGVEAGDCFGIELANVHDVDGDGRDELLVGASGVGRAHLISGKDGKQLAHVGAGKPDTEFGEAVAGIGDVNGDGFPDFAVGACRESSSGRVHLFSGKDCKELRVFEPVSSEERTWFGNSIAAAGDLDSDGRPDLLIGGDEVGYDQFARVYSSASGTVLLSIKSVGECMFNHFGSAVATLGDVNGDGVPDYLVGDPDDLPEKPPKDVGQAAGSVLVASGKTGAALFKVFGKKHIDCLGDCMAACGDLDGDHVPDFVAKAKNYPGGPPSWRAFSGRDGRELWAFKMPEASPPRSAEGKK